MDGKLSNYNEAETSLQALSPSLQNSMKKIIEEANYEQYNVVIKNFDTCGDNILGNLYEININGKTVESEKETHIFVKERIDLKKNSFFPINVLYVKEEFMYKEISKIFTSLQDQANVPHEDRYKIPKAYNETNSNAIILENLSKRGFNTYKILEPIPVKYAELAVQELAKFHALSFVIENKMPEYFDNNIKTQEPAIHFNEDFNIVMRKACSYIANLYDGEVKRKIEKFSPVILEKLSKYYEKKTNIKCTLTHGDFKKNNVLVRMKDGEPVEVITIDYQFIDYGCPIKDLLFFLFIGSDREFRKKNLNNLKNLYFEKLSRFLEYFDLDVETVYPRKEFDKLYAEWLDYGLIMMILGSVFLAEPGTEVDIQSLSLAELPYCRKKHCLHLLRELIDDFIQWGYL